MLSLHLLVLLSLHHILHQVALQVSDSSAKRSKGEGNGLSSLDIETAVAAKQPVIQRVTACSCATSHIAGRCRWFDSGNWGSFGSKAVNDDTKQSN
jgi:hypothetical protein